MPSSVQQTLTKTVQLPAEFLMDNGFHVLFQQQNLFPFQVSWCQQRPEVSPAPETVSH